MSKFNDLFAKLGITPQNEALFEQAFTHSSCNIDHDSISYERLEFLGDAVIGLIVAAFIYDEYPELSEGE